jgi:hypothetical protein
MMVLVMTFLFSQNKKIIAARVRISFVVSGMFIGWLSSLAISSFNGTEPLIWTAFLMPIGAIAGMIAIIKINWKEKIEIYNSLSLMTMISATALCLKWLFK